jgi:hypothetical protein
MGRAFEKPGFSLPGGAVCGIFDITKSVTRVLRDDRLE